LSFVITAIRNTHPIKSYLNLVSPLFAAYWILVPRRRERLVLVNRQLNGVRWMGRATRTWPPKLIGCTSHRLTDSEKAGTGRPGFFCSGSRIGCIFARDTRATKANCSGSRVGCFDLDFASDGIATAKRFRRRHACHVSHARSIVTISP